jgi:disulfide bond formation protein DsbB
MNAPVTRCDEAAFELFGISMAGYNGLLSLALAAFTFWGFTRAR